MKIYTEEIKEVLTEVNSILERYENKNLRFREIDKQEFASDHKNVEVGSPSVGARGAQDSVQPAEIGFSSDSQGRPAAATGSPVIDSEGFLYKLTRSIAKILRFR
jgi:hypothetical protein